jgi:hypothetical protein
VIFWAERETRRGRRNFLERRGKQAAETEGEKGKKRKPRGGKILEKEQRTNVREEEGGEQKTEGRVCF